MHVYLATYLDNVPSAQTTLASVQASDWGIEPRLLIQPPHWPAGKASATANHRRTLEAIAAGDADYALFLEDDVRVGRHLRHNLDSLPLLRRDQADYLSLFIPDLIADPWERAEPHLGYRLAKPRYTGPHAGWEKRRLWGSQALVLSRRLVRAVLDRWDALADGLDSRILTVCGELQLPLFYSAPCWVEHVPVKSGFGTPTAYAPDFDPDFKLTVGPGFQPPETIPGRLTWAEGKQLYDLAAGRRVLELGTASGRATVCLAQQAAEVVSVDVADQSAAARWVWLYDRADRLTFHKGLPEVVLPALSGRFDLILLDAEWSGPLLADHLTRIAPKLAPGGLVAVSGYPDPDLPHTRPMVDAHARTHGWKRISQTDYLGVFCVGGG